MRTAMRVLTMSCLQKDFRTRTRSVGCRLLGRFSTWALLCLAGLLVPTASLHAQQVVRGVVSDATTGLPVEGAEVRLEGTPSAVQTDARGRFVLQSVSAGIQRLTVDRIGYRCVDAKEIQVDEGDERILYITLTPIPIVLPPHRVEARGTETSPETATRRVTREQIARAGHRDLAEALDAIPGVHVVGSSETPGGTRVSVGGESPKRVAVLLDGLPLATGVDGAVDLDPIPLSAIQAVEVHSGSQAALAGDAAMGGVVNLVTRSTVPEARETVDLRGGSFGAYRGSVAASQRFSWFTGQAVYERFGRGDEFTYPDADTSATRVGVNEDGTRAFLGVSSSRPGDGQALAYTFRSDAGVPGALEQSTPDATTQRRQTRFQSKWEAALSSLRVNAAVWHESSQERYQSPVRFPKDSDFRERFTGGKLSAALGNSAVEAGVEGELRGRRLEGIDHLIPDSSFGVQHRLESTLRGRARLAGVVAGIQGSVAATIALDADDASSPITSPRIDLGLSVLHGVSVRGGWGQSFRRPPLTALFWKGDVFSAGNPNLRPERASEWDFGIRVSRGPVSIDSRYFERRVDDIIVWERDFTGKYKPQNVPSSFSVGREDHANLRVFGELLSIDYSHVLLDARDRSGETNHEGYVLVLTPRHTHDLEADIARGRWGGRFRGRWVSVRYTRRQNDRGKTLAAYRLLDAMARVTLHKHKPNIGISVHLDNITNERIEILERYPLPGRGISVATSVSF